MRAYRVRFASLVFSLPLFLMMLALGVAARGQGDHNVGLTPQQMLQSVDAPTVQKLTAASDAIEKNPSDANAWVTRAVISLGVAQHNPYSYQWVHFAAQDLEKALRLQPNNFYALHNYAMAYYQSGDFGDGQPAMHEAVAFFTKALAVKPDSARTYMGRGWAYLMMDDEAHADADFQKTLQLDPSLRDDLNKEADGIRQKRAQKGCVQAMMKRMGAYIVDHNARTAEQCAAHKGYWTNNECRISTAMAPGPLALGPQDSATGNAGLQGGGNCTPPRDAVDDKYNPRIGGSVVR